MELYSHVPVMRNVLDQLKVDRAVRFDILVLYEVGCAVYASLRRELVAAVATVVFLSAYPQQLPVLTPLPPLYLDPGAIFLQSWNYNVCAVFLLDATFISDPAKFVSGALLSLSAMVQLELPHLNVLTKCDLADRSEVRMTWTTQKS